MNPMQELFGRGRGSAVIDPWMYQDPAEHPIAECRSIPITDEIRAADALKQAALELPSTMQVWRDQVKLSVDNLRVRKVISAKPGRQVTVRVHVLVAKPVKVQRRCGVCLVVIGSNALLDFCKAHRPKARKLLPIALVQCDEPSCEKMLRRGRTEGKCSGCAAIERRPKVRVSCATAGCDRLLKFGRSEGSCKRCNTAARKAQIKISAEKPKARVSCATAGCDRLLKFGRSEGSCMRCNTAVRKTQIKIAAGKPLVAVTCETAGCGRKLRGDRTAGLCNHCSGVGRTAKYRAQRIEREGKTCDVCGVPIKWETKSGKCIKHAAGLRASRTILHAASSAELELDRCWAALSLDDKEHVLSGALSWCADVRGGG